MSRFRSLPSLALPLLLSGCPFSGVSKAFDVRAIVVTVPDQSQSTVTLSWDKYPDATIYNVSRRDAGGPAQLVRTLSDLRYSESVARGATLSYSVAALASNGETKGTAPEKFLVAPGGEVVARFRPAVEPEADEVVAAIEASLS